jgi:hypothetical protein
MLVVMPVLLLVLLAAADLGRLFVISGKNEIAARYTALRQFRADPFGDAYPAQGPRQEIAGLFFDDTLNDHSDADQDVTYEEFGVGELGYEFDDHGDPLLIVLGGVMTLPGAPTPMGGTGSTFTYDLFPFPYGREHPMEQTQALQSSPSSGRLAANYDASGHFVMLSDSFTGTQGDYLRIAMLGEALIVGQLLAAPAVAAITAVLWLIFV